MKTPEELAEEALQPWLKNEIEHQFGSMTRAGTVQAVARAIRLAQVEAWREAALIVEDLLQEHVIYGVKLTAQGLDDRIKKLRATADAIQAELDKEAK